MMHDITEQKRNEEQLAYYARLLENAEDAVIAVNDRFVVTTWSKGAERLYGWTAEEVLGGDVGESHPYRHERRRTGRDAPTDGRGWSHAEGGGSVLQGRHRG
jgi:PAS domain-containing protein